MSANVILKKGEGRTLKAGGAWIYDNEIDKIEGEFENGDMVFVSDFDGYKLQADRTHVIPQKRYCGR